MEIKWRINTVNIDLENGEIITTEKRKEQYKIVKTTTDTKFVRKNDQVYGYQTKTNECRRQAYQLRIEGF